MKPRRMFLLAGSLIISCALLADQSGDTESSEGISPQGLTPEQKAAIERFFADQKSANQNIDEGRTIPKPSGEWSIEKGSLECEGFLTRTMDEDFCSAEVPDDWLPFEFNGKTYYVQPLA